VTDAHDVVPPQLRIGVGDADQVVDQDIRVDDRVHR
jgi:hypothetical protein